MEFFHIEARKVHTPARGGWQFKTPAYFLCLSSIQYHYLTHWGLVTHIRVDECGSHWSFKSWLVVRSCQLSHCEQNSKKFYQNTQIFIEVNAFENDVCKIPPIWFRPQCVHPINLSIPIFSPYYLFRMDNAKGWFVYKNALRTQIR